MAISGFERAKAFLAEEGFEDRIQVFNESTATVALAAQAVGCEEARIAKSLSFYNTGYKGAIMVIAAGDVKIDNRRFKDTFGFKAKMLKGEDVEELTGYDIGGVCPFGVPEDTDVYLDESLYRFEVVYPACGNAFSAVRLTLPEFESLIGEDRRVDVCKGWREGE